MTSSDEFQPAYLRLDRAELQARIERAVAGLAECTTCPRNCRVNRLKDETGFCRTGRHAVVSSAFPHFGEEDCLRGHGGSGTIFFSWCNLGCMFCQNWDISHEGEGRTVLAGRLARLMIELQAMGCHNINFVTPSHVVPQILEALPAAIDMGLRLPLVYNTGTYDSLATLGLLEGIFDIYMPDFKFWHSQPAEQFLGAADYPQIARAAIAAMHRQVGDLQLDARGIALRGLLVRHLVMPNNLAGTRQICRFLANEISPHTFINIMPQYRPAGQARQFETINRPITRQEFLAAVEAAQQEGLYRLDSRRL